MDFTCEQKKIRLCGRARLELPDYARILMAEVGAFSDQAQVQEAVQGTKNQFSGTGFSPELRQCAGPKTLISFFVKKMADFARMIWISNESTYIYPGLRIRIRMDPYYFWRLALDPVPHLCERPDPEKQNSGA
jgi:hypothetical protein